MSKINTKGIKLSNGHTIKPVVLDCCLGTTGEGPPSLFGGISQNLVIDKLNSTIVLKSITRNPKIGNFGSSIFSKDGWAKSGFFGIPFPKKFCYISLFGRTRNAFGLTNKGIDDFLHNDWRVIVRRGTPVIISVFIEFNSATESDIKQAYEDAEYMMEQINYRCKKNYLIAVIFNASCPNVSAGVCKTSDAIVECARRMKKTAPEIPLGVKLSYVQPVELGVRLYNEANVDFLQGINTIPFKVMYPNRISLLSHIGGGGISGPEITAKALEYVSRLRELLPDAKIIGSGGISTLDDAIQRVKVVDSIAIANLVNKNSHIANIIIKHFFNQE